MNKTTFLSQQNMQNSSNSHVPMDLLQRQLQSRSLVFVALESGLLSLIDAVALLGNALVCLALYRNPRLRTVPNFYILSLAISDFFVASICLPLSVGALIEGRWDYSSKACQVQGYLIFVFCITSLHTMALTAMNRYCRVLKPNCYPRLYTVKATAASIISVWLWAFICSALPMILGYSHFAFHPGTVICYSPPFFSASNGATVLFCSTILINVCCPIVALMVLYPKVFRAIRKQKVHIAQYAPNNTVSARSPMETSTGETRTAKLLFAVVLTSFICWGPVMLVECLRTFGPWALPRYVYLVSTYFGATSSAVNVFIYGTMNRAFRVEFGKIICHNR